MFLGGATVGYSAARSHRREPLIKLRDTRQLKHALAELKTMVGMDWVLGAARPCHPLWQTNAGRGDARDGPGSRGVRDADGAEAVSGPDYNPTDPVFQK